jgi:hypothetical protein
MSESYISHQAHAQRLHHDEKLLDLIGSLQGQEARGIPDEKGCDTFSRGGGGRDDLRLTSLSPQECCMTNISSGSLTHYG